MKDLILQRSISVQCWNVLGVIAKANKRPELTLVLHRTREQGQTSAKDVAEHLLFESDSRRVVAERLLDIAENFKLLKHATYGKGQYVLTEAGNKALETEQIFVPECGAWTIWVSNDPLLGYPLLHAEPFKEPKALETFSGNGGRGKKDRKFASLPDMLRDLEGRDGSPPCGRGEALRIDKFKGNVEEADSDCTLKLVWTAGMPTMRLQGVLRGQPVNSVLDAPDLSSGLVWQWLLEAEGIWSCWDQARKALLVGFDETNDYERESLMRDLRISDPTLGQLGRFDALTIQDVPIRALTESDVRRWAEWRLKTRLSDYVTDARFDAWTKEALAPFGSYEIPTPSRTELARDEWAGRGERPSPRAWHLMAAEDWSL
ncbi:hypothetical protein FE249_06905 [Acidiphilium multivorum]|uniref:hypothetical protein n=1 Tax=Acidiphilium multivorum TaxID=62140 RepID=UPI001F4C17B1|nr:hypothetical protein [Acidiphilium multivorum]UNC13964.1 hypothetical protein FE249_06905 [Acidiphilium multivorum]